MSKLIFSTLSILTLLLSGTNCSTGIRGGGGGDSQIGTYSEISSTSKVNVRGGGGGGSQTCTERLVLNPGDECNGSDSSGLDYSLRNNAGKLEPKGSYIDSNHSNQDVYVSGGGGINMSNNTISNSSGSYTHGSLYLTRNDKAWTIISLP